MGRHHIVLKDLPPSRPLSANATRLLREFGLRFGVVRYVTLYGYTVMGSEKDRQIVLIVFYCTKWCKVLAICCTLTTLLRSRQTLDNVERQTE